MNSLTPTPQAPAPPRPRAQRGTHQARELQLDRVSPEARRNAAAVLEVLAGLRTPAQAAEGLKMALPGYYKLELRALQALMGGCEPPRKGRQKDAASELAALQRRCEKLTAEVHRYQALARATQRTIGLAPPPAQRPAPGRRRRKPAVRALQAIALIKGAPEAPAPVSPAS